MLVASYTFWSMLTFMTTFHTSDYTLPSFCLSTHTHTQTHLTVCHRGETTVLSTIGGFP